MYEGPFEMLTYLWNVIEFFQAYQTSITLFQVMISIITSWEE